MPTPSDTKRIVPKARYVGIMGRRFTARILYLGCVIAGIAGLGATFALMCVALAYPTPWYFEIFLFPFGILFGFLFMAGREGLEAVRQEEAIVPMTRQTVSALSSAESLVRASNSTEVCAETMLLRPSTEQTATRPDQLLRPHTHD